MANEQALIDVELLQRLSSYKFTLGIKNSSLQIDISNDPEVKEEVNAAELLYILENGSPLHNVIAVRPIEKTWLELQEHFAQSYNRCVEGIIAKNWSVQDIEIELTDCSHKLENRLKMNVDQRIKDTIECSLYYQGRKIN